MKRLHVLLILTYLFILFWTMVVESVVFLLLL